MVSETLKIARRVLVEIAFLEMGLFVVCAYVIGSIPTGAWFAQWWCGMDIRQHGSGNIGASNIARVLGKRFFVPIFLFDAGKAYAVLALGALFLPLVYVPVFIYLAPAALLIGNGYSCFLNFRGGKGVATVVGIMLYVLPAFVGVFACAWLALLVVSRKPFIASLGAMVLATGVMTFWDVKHVPFLLCIIAWLVFAHRANLKKL